ncbi:MAG: DUF4145 domain-containing protein [Nitrospirota bacterium]
MDIKEKITGKFNLLLEEGIKIIQANGWDGHNWRNFPSNIDYLRWRTESLNLIKRVCGEDSEHYKQLLQIAEDKESKNNSFYFTHCYGIVEAAKRDFDGDFLADVKYLVRADLLDDFISQSEMLLQEGFHVPAASLAGGVLEDTLRKLCDKKGIIYPPVTKIDPLNISLAKANAYDKLVQKEITAKADIRNNADHGHFDKIKPEDVTDMIKWLRRFIRDYMK